MNRTYGTKEIIKIAFPILVSILMEQLLGMTDTAFLGRVGEVELGASALAGVYYMAIFMIAFGFSIGSQIIIARRNGEKNYKEIGTVFYHGVYFQLALAVVAILFSIIFSPYILRNIISSKEIYTEVNSYINWRVFGCLFSFVSIMYRAFFIGTTQTKTLILNSVIMVLCNGIFNYILIFGKFGCPALGISGAAIGSALAEGVSLLYFVIYTYKRIDNKKYGLNRFVRFCPKILMQILNLSVWIMIQCFFSMAIWFIFFILVEHMGERPLAITNIVRNISSVPFMIVMAFASTCSSLVSNTIGAGGQKDVMALIKKHIYIAFAFVVPFLIIICLIPNAIISIYTSIIPLQEASIGAFYVMCGSYIFSIPAGILFQAVSGTGKTKITLLIELLALSIYIGYAVYIINYLHVDIAVCWTAEYVYGFFSMMFCALYLRSRRWMNKAL